MTEGSKKPRLDRMGVRAASSSPPRALNETGRRNTRRPDWVEPPGATRAAAREETMAESVYKVIELVGTSTESWEKAAAAAVARASKSVRDLRVAEVVEQDLVIEKGKVEAFRTKLKVSFKYEGKDD
jgi:flavin-binding protein dodecin